MFLPIRCVKSVATSFHHRLIRLIEVVVWVGCTRPSVASSLLPSDWGLLPRVYPTSLLPRAYLLTHSLRPYIEIVASGLQDDPTRLILLYVELWVFGLIGGAASPRPMVEIILSQREPRYVFIGKVRCVLLVAASHLLRMACWFGCSSGWHHTREVLRPVLTRGRTRQVA